MENSKESLFDSACGMSGIERQDYLDKHCGENAQLRKDLESLLLADQQYAGILDQGAELQLFGLVSEPKVGDSIGRYQLVKRLGAGGMGLVFLAQQSDPIFRQVAVKVIHNGSVCSVDVVRRFAAERQVLALFDHPGVTKVLDGGLTDTGLPYFVMEYVEGESITCFCKNQQLQLLERLRLFVDVCHAFEHAHQKGVIHRDIKPSNILVYVSGGALIPKVIDFGIAKAIGDSAFSKGGETTRFGSLMGTPQYMSPEQARMDGTAIDVRTDVYSLGVLLYELLVDSTPIRNEEIQNLGLLRIFEIIRDRSIELPSLRAKSLRDDSSLPMYQGLSASKYCRRIKGELDWIVTTALEKNPSHRYACVGAFRDDIERFLSGDPVSVAAPSAAYRARKLIAKNWIPFLSVTIIVAVLLAATVFSSLHALKANKAHKNSEFLAHQLHMKSESLSDALSLARSGESLRKALFRNKRDEAAIERAYAWHVNAVLAELTQGAVNPKAEVLGLEDEVMASFYLDSLLSKWPFAGYLEAPAVLRSASAMLAVLFGFKHSDVRGLANDSVMPPIMFSQDFIPAPKPPFDLARLPCALFLPASGTQHSAMNPGATFSEGGSTFMSQMGLDCLLPGQDFETQKFPALGSHHGFEVPGFRREALVFVECLIKEQRREFGNSAPIVYESILVKAQLLMLEGRNESAEESLKALLKEKKFRKRAKIRCIFARLLLAKCNSSPNCLSVQSKAMFAQLDHLKVDKKTKRMIARVINR